MTDPTEKPIVTHQPDSQRFELSLENHLAVLEYYLANGIIAHLRMCLAI